MKNKPMVLTALFLVISIANYTRIASGGSVRTVEFLSIFAIGALSGILLVQLFKFFRQK